MAIKKYKAPPFVMVKLEMLKDPDWRNLSSSAKIIYIYLKSKFNHKTLGQVSLSYGEIGDMFSSKTISRAFKELQDKSWIEKIKQGGLFGGVCSYKFNGKYKEFIYLKQRFNV
ncbi:MAG TPA: hypothetical protein ENI08_01345 [Candidatus Dependentiae bacterium]|nr:hypothetical protein [Candidatus Dependentiae bacterium]